MTSSVFSIKTKGQIIEDTGKIMRKSGCKKYLKEPIFVKVNLLSNQVVPGQCTSPHVLEGVLKQLKKDGFKDIAVGDANVATSRQVMKAAKKWKHLEICKKYDVRFVNLSKEKRRKIDSPVFGRIGIPEILLDSNSILTLPVLKTHNVAGFTCALKNQWGCLPEVRHNYHLMLDKCIPEINKILNPKFVITDATVCLEGTGPRTGKPKIMNAIFASNDLVAMDSFCGEIIGTEDVPYLINAEKEGIGSRKYKLIGDKIEKTYFEPAILHNHPIVFLEFVFRKIPGINWLLFKTPLFRLASLLAAFYNSVVWYNLKGRKYAREVVRENEVYREEFKELI